MMRRVLPSLLLLVWASLGLAQGFAGLGTEVDGFDIPAPGQELVFPADHGAHPSYRIEWWYLTANLTTEAGEDLGLQWTLFRSALAPKAASGWNSTQLWLGHAAVTRAQSHSVAERLGRGGNGQAGVRLEPFEAWIDDWQMISPNSKLDQLNLSARGDDFSYDVTLHATGPLVLQGAAGYSVKSASGQASYYYSQPSYQVTGTVLVEGETLHVTGDAWLDHEWSSQPLEADQSGWDWFSLRFETGEKLMGFVLRGAESDFRSGTWISAEGLVTALPPGAFQAEPLDRTEVEGREVPTRWRLRLPDQNLDITVEALNPKAWMATRFPYWEGPVRASGSHQGKGYLEMTGYSPTSSNNPANP